MELMWLSFGLIMLGVAVIVLELAKFQVISAQIKENQKNERPPLTEDWHGRKPDLDLF